MLFAELSYQWVDLIFYACLDILLIADSHESMFCGYSLETFISLTLKQMLISLSDCLYLNTKYNPVHV